MRPTLTRPPTTSTTHPSVDRLEPLAQPNTHDLVGAEDDALPGHNPRTPHGEPLVECEQALLPHDSQKAMEG
eukprot:scaffold18102_cov129-Isochrysis_galbana.AAC.4